MHRDGFHQSAAHVGVAPYKPNSLDGGCPFVAGAGDHAFIEVPAQAPGVLAGENADQVLTATIGLLGQHRVWDRFPVPVDG
jgi:C-terminal domain found in long catalases